MAISFDGPNKLITLSLGTVTLDVPDLYSRWKDWLATSDNSKYLIAFAPVGGDDIDTGIGSKVPLYAFLQNGWRLRPQEASHTLNVTGGILLVDGGGDPFVNTVGAFIVRINYQQPVQAIKLEVGTSGLTAGESATLAKIDSLDTRIPAALVSGKIDSTLSVAEREAMATVLLDLTSGVELNATLRQALRLLLSIALGNTSGFPAAPVYRDYNNTKDRVTGTLDGDGNRTITAKDPA